MVTRSIIYCRCRNYRIIQYKLLYKVRAEERIDRSKDGEKSAQRRQADERRCDQKFVLASMVALNFLSYGKILCSSKCAMSYYSISGVRRLIAIPVGGVISAER